MNDNTDLMNQSATWDTNKNSVKTEPNDANTTNIKPRNKTMTSTTELKLEDEFNTPVILATEKVIIKEELNIDEVLYDESPAHVQTSSNEIEPLATPETETVLPTENIECKICGGKFTENPYLDNHLFIMHRVLTVNGTGAFCNKCKNWFPEMKYPYHSPCFYHMRLIQYGEKMNSTCKICGASFPFKRLLICHLTLMHRPYTLNGEGAYCTRCHSWFTERNFKSHQPCMFMYGNNMYVFCCNICKKEFKFWHLLKMHLHVIHRPLTLRFCDKCNRWFKDYKMHKCFQQLRHNTNTWRYSCSICAKDVVNAVNMKKHLYYVHRPVTAKHVAGQVFCDFCKYCFDEDKFEGHVPCHSVDSKCMFCLITMPNKDHYLLHDLTWKRWRSYQCNFCDLNTEDWRLANLNEHVLRHEKKSIFRCVKCNFHFNSTENADAHIETSHLGCRCVMEPCICSIYSYDYYYEFVTQRNTTSDFRERNKNILENELIKVMEEQYNSIESNIDVYHMKKEFNTLENNLNLQTEYDLLVPDKIMNFSMPSTSASVSTIMEDFSSIPPGTSKIVENPQLHENHSQQETTPKTDDVLLIESPAEKRRRLHGKSEKRRNQRRETRLKKEEKQRFANAQMQDESNSEPTFDFVNIEAPTIVPEALIPEVEKVSKQKPGRNMHKKGDNERHEIFLARRRVYMQNYRRMKSQQPKTEEENEEEAAERRARINERIRIARQKREALMSEEELLQRRAAKAEKVRQRRRLQREQLSEEELSQIRAIEAERKRMKRRQLSKEQKQKLEDAFIIPNQLSEDEIFIKNEKTDDDSSCLTNDEDQIVEQLRNEQLKELNRH